MEAKRLQGIAEEGVGDSAAHSGEVAAARRVYHTGGRPLGEDAENRMGKRGERHGGILLFGEISSRYWKIALPSDMIFGGPGGGNHLPGP